MLPELMLFMRSQGLRGTQAIGSLLNALETESDDDLIGEVEAVMEGHSLLESQRIDTLILAMADAKAEEEGEEHED